MPLPPSHSSSSTGKDGVYGRRPRASQSRAETRRARRWTPNKGKVRNNGHSRLTTENRRW
ncbi:hypothetical protein AURDEDRAFT_114745 [Auricularia subglabra TFB-10046 SS5]|nr:hypothetical protein AURDEDRAFT_114745 [Auricularia subglabra TFB-10046 SS5]